MHTCNIYVNFIVYLSKKQMNLTDLMEFFKTVEKWPEIVRLDTCSTTLDTEKTVQTHIEFLTANSGKPHFKPYFDRLITIYKAIINTKTPDNENNENDTNISGFISSSSQYMQSAK